MSLQPGRAVRIVLVSLLWISVGFSSSTRADDPPALTSDQASALDRISADSLRGHLSFIASDLLEGRDTPSRGLDLAAEYIASQFRRAGLEPVGDDGYFQTATLKHTKPDVESFSLEIKSPEGAAIKVPPAQVTFLRPEGVDVKPTGIFKVDLTNAEALAALFDITNQEVLSALKPEQVVGKVVLAEYPKLDRQAAVRLVNALMTRMRELRAALVVLVHQPGTPTAGLGAGQVSDGENPRPSGPPRAERRPFLIMVTNPSVRSLFEALPPGVSDKATLSFRLGPPVPRSVKVRNVAGLLRGSDPVLKDTYVLVTAHYDHLGNHGPVGPEGGDRTYNGANDDGSGTVSVVELAGALGSLKTRPRRSLLFLTFFGEEKGLLGSRYYGRHPLVPIAKTVADVNLEQVGRTDDSEGPRVGKAVMTGYGYSEVTDVFNAAGKAEGVELVRHPQFSDSFFARSDNQALADLGVPAHTIAVAFIFPDYHGLADHWDKIDYANMARIDRTVGRGLLMIADTPSEPRWSESNPKAAKYLKAWKALHKP
jgi:hypothetical protein